MITVVLDPPGSPPIEKKVTVKVTKAPTLAYRFEKTILSFREQGSSRWPDFNLGDPNAGNKRMKNCLLSGTRIAYESEPSHNCWILQTRPARG